MYLPSSIFFLVWIYHYYQWKFNWPVISTRCEWPWITTVCPTVLCCARCNALYSIVVCINGYIAGVNHINIYIFLFDNNIYIFFFPEAPATVQICEFDFWDIFFKAVHRFKPFCALCMKFILVASCGQHKLRLVFIIIIILALFLFFEVVVLGIPFN